MHNEYFYGGKKIKKLSWREIQEMLKNMKKVDDIQKKAQQYHKKESEEVEKLLDQINE